MRWVARTAVVLAVTAAGVDFLPPGALLAVGGLLVLPTLTFIAPDPPAPGE